MSIAKINHIFHLFRVKGNSAYMIGEKITQFEHAVQSWRWMRKNSDCVALQTAAFLHDIGHLIGKHDPIDPFKNAVDDRHQVSGSRYLQTLGFPASVYMPVRMHVDAKRYLCTLSNENVSDYEETLSEASKLTFRLQGGKMDVQEIQRFLASKYLDSALLLRYADDRGKVMGDAPLSDSEMHELEIGMQVMLESTR